MNPAPKQKQSPFSWSRLIQPSLFALLAFVLIADYQGWLNVVREILDQPHLTYSFGKVQISAYEVLQGLTTLALIVWVANTAVRFTDKRIGRLRKLHPSSRALIQKIIMILIYVVAFFTALGSLGINLASLAVIGGAVGIGLGFGLQKIASNFISGLILLIERTIKIGDLIDVSSGVSGFVRKIAARYTLIETFEGREIMVPNEEFITTRVTSWTYSNRKGQIKIPVRVAYDTDLETAHKLIISVAQSHEKVLKDPGVVCFLIDFAESYVVFSLMFWVDDIQDNAGSVKHDVLMSLWRTFREHNIVMPFPQRDIYLHHAPSEKVQS
jgi:small-conductance mechanosensitive channel